MTEVQLLLQLLRGTEESACNKRRGLLGMKGCLVKLQHRGEHQQRSN